MEKNKFEIQRKYKYFYKARKIIKSHTYTHTVYIYVTIQSRILYAVKLFRLDPHWFLTN